jgi:hypothetical protein
MEGEMLTLEKLVKTMRDFEIEQDARDLDLFLSDHWHTYRMIREGALIFQMGDQVYVCERKAFEPRFLFPPPPRLLLSGSE